MTGFGDLSNLFNFGLDTSKSLLGSGTKDVGTGTSALTTSLDYFKRLMSGDRAVTAQATAPESNAVLSQADAQRRNRVATGTARGGGVAGANQQQQDDTMAKIDNFLFGARPAAAQQVTNIGKDIAGIGLGETSAALGFGDLAEKSSSDLSSIAGEARVNDYKINQDTVKQVTSTIMDVLAALA